MKRIVLDASAAVRLVMAHPVVDSSVFDALSAADRVLVPRLYFSEVASALWKYVRTGGVTEPEALERLREAKGLVSEVAADEDLAEEALSAAVRFEHSVHDALYAVLARRHSCPVLTMDSRLGSLLAEMRVDSV